MLHGSSPASWIVGYRELKTELVEEALDPEPEELGLEFPHCRLPGCDFAGVHFTSLNVLCLWLCWVFIAARGLSHQVACGISLCRCKAKRPNLECSL